jgi:hypothetical protein
MQTAPCALRTKSKRIRTQRYTLHPITYLDGVMEKYIPDYESLMFPKTSWLYQERVWWVCWKWENACMFYRYQSYHWGNSGSPAIANGNLILTQGVEGTMSDIYYDPSILQKYHGRHTLRTLLWINTLVQNLISELKLVHPKKSKQLKRKP